MRTKGIGPNNLGISPLKLKSSPKKDPPVQGGNLGEVTVTASLPKEQPSLSNAIKYVAATGKTAKSWKSKQHPSMIQHLEEPIAGYPPIVGGGKAVKVGFNLAKKAASVFSKRAPRVVDAIGDGIEARDAYKVIKGKLR